LQVEGTAAAEQVNEATLKEAGPLKPVQRERKASFDKANSV
jgi:hypothetical protein